MSDTHYFFYDQPTSRGTAIALCGKRVHERTVSPTPTCPRCAERLAAHEALTETDVFGPMPTEGSAS